MISTEDVLARTYEDSCDIYRRGSPTKDPATKQTSQQEALVAEAVPCALSQGSGGGLQTAGLHAETSRQHTLFTRPGADIRAGDHLVITQKGGRVRELWAGDPFAYEGSHKETPLLEEAPT